METNNILKDQLKQLSKTNAFLARQGQEDKNSTDKNDSYIVKLDATKYCWTRGCRVTKGQNIHSFKTNKKGHQYGYTRAKELVVLENNNYWRLLWR